MKFGGHQTFHLRDNWLFKGMDLVSVKGDTFADTESTMKYLGVGSNMVPSIKYWLQATGVVQKTSKGKLELSPFAQILNEFDKFFEWHGTAWLVHYKLATNPEEAPVFYWFFNKFGASEFTAESAIGYLERYVAALGRKVNENTISKDIHVLLRTYLASDFEGKETPEENVQSPLASLNLLEQTTAGYRVVPKSSSQIPTEVFGVCLLDFWSEKLSSPKEFKFDELWQRDCSPGKVFNLNNSETLDALDALVEKFPQQFSYKRSGGYFTVSVLRFTKTPLLKHYYEVTDA